MWFRFYIQVLILLPFASGFGIKAEKATPIDNVGQCQTANNETAICIYLEDCVGLKDILNSGNISDSQKTYLRESQCGFKNNKVLICCAMRFQRRRSHAVSKFSLLPSSEDCGYNPPHFNVLGGRITDREEYPWTALLIYRHRTTHELSAACGGTLINEQYVLTAAHCVIDTNDYELESVRLGEWNITSNPDCFKFNNDQLDCADSYKDVKVVEVHMHPNFSSLYTHDISLLKLGEKVTYSKMIKPICLPISTEMQNKALLGEEVRVIGWGYTETGFQSQCKMMAKLTVRNVGSCNEVYPKDYTVTSSQLCVGGKEGVDSCKGDSGGPLVWMDPEAELTQYYQVGITSYGPSDCGKRNWPGVYTRVDKYIDWILNILEP